MITGGKITYVEAKRDKENPINGLSINVGLDDLIIEEGVVEIKYTYTVDYADDVGKLIVKGSVFAEEEPKKIEEIRKTWKEAKNNDRKLPEDFAEMVLNSINYACGTNGTLVVRPLNLPAPMVPPRIKLTKP